MTESGRKKVEEVGEQKQQNIQTIKIMENKNCQKRKVYFVLFYQLHPVLGKIHSENEVVIEKINVKCGVYFLDEVDDS